MTTRVLHWPDCRNARDLGGLPTRDGRRIRFGAIVRSDSHDRLTGDGIAAVRGAGISRVLDLRSASECETCPSPFAGTPIYLNVALLDESDPVGTDALHVARTLADAYRVILDFFGRQVGAAVAALAEAPTGGLVVHCHAGKDRTGIVVALALAVAGVIPEAIAEDYALSDGFLRPLYAEQLAAVSTADERERMGAFHTSMPETILGALEHLDSRHGGPVGYLRRNGVSDRHLTILRLRLRESVPQASRW